MGNKKRSTSTPGLEDVITEDGILCSILSNLQLREAVRTSLLSSRWRFIWTHLPNLSFTVENLFDAHALQALNSPLTWQEKWELLRGKTDQFIQSVNSVMQQHRGRARIDQIDIIYFLRKIHSQHLDSWVRFAVASNPEKLRIILEHPKFQPPLPNQDMELYVFPFELLGSSSIKQLYLASCSLKLPFSFGGLKYLKVLVLFYIDATEEDIICILSNCPGLEKFATCKARTLASLRIVHPQNKLQHLVVHCRNQFGEIVMNAVNLSTLVYGGIPVDFRFTQSAQLKFAIIGFKFERNKHNLDFYITKLTRNLPHLRSLNFKIRGVPPEVAKLPELSNSFVHMKYLTLEWNVNLKMSLLQLAILLDVAPFLEILKLHLLVRMIEQPLQELSVLREMLPKHPHSLLEKIEITGFYFDQWQIQVVLYLLSNASQLKSLTIKKGREPLVEIHETDIVNLSKVVPANVMFVIL